jgi:hypothetical protein
VPLFEYLAGHPTAAAVFDAAIASGSRRDEPAIVAAYDFKAVHHVVDVGGGMGSFLSLILSAHPTIRGTLVELSHVAERACARLEASAWGGRMAVIGGSALDALPPGGDCYMLKMVIYGQDDERAISILKNCRMAAESEARVLVIEPVVRPGNAFSVGKWLDLQMLVLPGGRERTEAEHRGLFAAAGLTLTRVIETATPHSIVEATT